MPVQLVRYVRVLLLLTVAQASAWGSTWTYYDIREPRNQFLLQRDPDGSAWVDVAEGAVFCTFQDKYLCFGTEKGFKFAIPRDFTGKEHEWSHDGATYTLVGTSRRKLFGRMYTTYLVETQMEALHVRFHFTREAGVIGITSTDTSRGLFLLLGERCGFGAPPSCYRR